MSRDPGMASVPLLLCSIDELNVSLKRSSRLPRPPWFIDRLQLANLDAHVPFPTINNRKSPSRRVICVAIVMVTPGERYCGHDALPGCQSQEFELQSGPECLSHFKWDNPSIDSADWSLLCLDWWYVLNSKLHHFEDVEWCVCRNVNPGNSQKYFLVKPTHISASLFSTCPSPLSLSGGWRTISQYMLFLWRSCTVTFWINLLTFIRFGVTETESLCMWSRLTLGGESCSDRFCQKEGGAAPVSLEMHIPGCVILPGNMGGSVKIQCWPLLCHLQLLLLCWKGSRAL